MPSETQGIWTACLSLALGSITTSDFQVASRHLPYACSCLRRWLANARQWLRWSKAHRLLGSRLRQRPALPVRDPMSAKLTLS